MNAWCFQVFALLSVAVLICEGYISANFSSDKQQGTSNMTKLASTLHVPQDKISNLRHKDTTSTTRQKYTISTTITRQQDTLFQYKSILETRLPSWIVCADLCSRMKMCKSFNFDSKTGICEILDQVPVECSLKSKSGHTFVSRSNIPENMAGNCYMNDCGLNEICIEKNDRHVCAPLNRPKLIRSKDLDCDFENECTCSWRQTSSSSNSADSKDDFNWLIRRGETQSDRTGPPSDHTKGTIDGVYIYIEASRHENNSFAELVTDLLPGNHSFCLTLWYFMYGININKLEVGIKAYRGSFLPVQTVVGDQGYQWKKLDVNLNSVLDYVVGIRAYRGESTKGDISIDDIVVSDGPC